MQDPKSCKVKRAEAGWQFLLCHAILEWLQSRHLRLFSSDYISFKKMLRITIIPLVLLLQRAGVRIERDHEFSQLHRETFFHKHQAILEIYQNYVNYKGKLAKTLISGVVFHSGWIENILRFPTWYIITPITAHLLGHWFKILLENPICWPSGGIQDEIVTEKQTVLPLSVILLNWSTPLAWILLFWTNHTLFFHDKPSSVKSSLGS